jgi:predicted HicB family RNase H-like nuclease
MAKIKAEAKGAVRPLLALKGYAAPSIKSKLQVKRSILLSPQRRADYVACNVFGAACDSRSPGKPDHAPGTRRRVAVTLRLTPERHLRLRLASALTGRSAQELVSEALDRSVHDVPGLSEFVVGLISDLRAA